MPLGYPLASVSQQLGQLGKRNAVLKQSTSKRVSKAMSMTILNPGNRKQAPQASLPIGDATLGITVSRPKEAATSDRQPAESFKDFIMKRQKHWNLRLLCVEHQPPFGNALRFKAGDVTDSQASVKQHQAERSHAGSVVIAKTVLGRVGIAGAEDFQHFFFRERKCWNFVDTRKLYLRRRIALNPFRVQAKSEEAPKSLQLFDRGDWSVFERRPEAAQVMNVKFKQVGESRISGPGKQLLFEQDPVLCHRVRTQVTAPRVLEEEPHGVLYRNRFDRLKTSLFFQGADSIDSCLPGPEIERLPDLATAKRSLNPKRTVAAFVLPRSVRTDSDVPPVNGEHRSKNSGVQNEYRELW